MDLILTGLPVRDAVRTSILSKKWRYKWVSIPDIYFEEDCLMKDESKPDHVNDVDQVLSHHVGPICKFSCLCYVPTGSHFDRWIDILSMNGIKKLILEMMLFEEYYDVSPSVFNCQQLCHLELIYCILEVPPTFKGFHNLSVLVLTEVSISAEAIAFLISKCPLLETLKLLTKTCPAFHIHAPNLRYLELDGDFHFLSIGSCPHLTNMSLDYWFRLGYSGYTYLEGSDFLQFIECSLAIERLALRGTVLEFLCDGSIPKKLSATYDHLKCLEFEIRVNSDEILVILCILRSAPNLEELKIRYFTVAKTRFDLSEEYGEFWGAVTQFDCLLSHLRTVEIFGLAMLLDLEFIGCILSNAPVLETMKVYTNENVKNEDVPRLLDELMHFQRASTAEIKYMGHCYI
ncbi:F-box/FBD/LRR-repeat protein [Cinnamomum micranthum f. kanehirae]|uniref:F-box/FBD/LRR-repeat protein n=1 Tax=Cinnamomum micranthum f. kanehirae TaxID=337451 RepID=A0A443NRY8_9MAGN|nr:F-box/FBD/LRR-repeat protein [Cinnamomum micranthum f. kanehirae]